MPWDTRNGGTQSSLRSGAAPQVQGAKDTSTSLPLTCTIKAGERQLPTPELHSLAFSCSEQTLHERAPSPPPLPTPPPAPLTPAQGYVSSKPTGGSDQTPFPASTGVLDVQQNAPQSLIDCYLCYFKEFGVSSSTIFLLHSDILS